MTEIPPEPPGARFTERLRLDPITTDHAPELWRIHNHDAVACWYQNWRPTLQEVTDWAATMQDSWAHFGVHKWIAHHRITGELVGRGGASPTPADEDWGRINQFLPQEPWATGTRRGPRGDVVHANWVELGWALLPEFWGAGFAAEIGQAGLTYALENLEMHAVVSCTAQDNERSIAVMERIGMTHAGHLDDLDGGPPLTVYLALR